MLKIILLGVIILIVYIIAIKYKEEKEKDRQNSNQISKEKVILETNFDDALKQSSLGDFYYIGRDNGINYDEVFKYYKEAAEKGYTHAQYILSLMYYNGQGTDKNYYEAIRWITKAANGGDINAKQLLKELFNTEDQNIDKVKQSNYKKLYVRCRRAAESGNSKAQYNLGQFYFHGEVIEQDFHEAFEWFKKSAEQGDSNSQYMVGYLYHIGIGGIDQSYDEAIKWLQKSVNQGNVEAKMELEKVYEEIESGNTIYSMIDTGNFIRDLKEYIKSIRK